MFITITRTGLCRIGVGLSVFAVLTAVFILFRAKMLSQQPPNRRFPRLSATGDCRSKPRVSRRPAMSPPRNCGSTMRFTSVTRAERPST